MTAIMAPHYSVSEIRPSARDDDEIGAFAGLVAKTVVGHDQRGTRNHQLRNAIDRVLRDVDPSERLLGRLRRRQIVGRFLVFFVAPVVGPRLADRLSDSGLRTGFGGSPGIETTFQRNVA